MKEALAIIERIIQEHKVIIRGVHSLERVANDAEAMMGFDKAKDAFMPGRFEQKQGLQQLQDLMGIVDKGLRKHFRFEETALLAAFEKHGDKEMASALQSLLLEHRDIRNRLDHSKRHVSELVSGNMTRHLWEASAHDMRAHMSHTRKLIDAHTSIEQELLHKLKRRLQEKTVK